MLNKVKKIYKLASHLGEMRIMSLFSDSQVRMPTFVTAHGPSVRSGRVNPGV